MKFTKIINQAAMTNRAFPHVPGIGRRTRTIALRIARGWWLILLVAVVSLSQAGALEEPAKKKAATGIKLSNSDTFKAMRYGIFIHNVYALSLPPAGTKYNTPDEFANLFDVKEFANQMQAIGVEYVFFTAWHFAMYNLGPNKAMDKWLPGHTTRRDLVGEVADALNAKGIKLIIYAHPNDGHDLKPDEQAKVGYIKDHATPMPVFNNFINEFYAEVASRYAKKPNVLGFWWDSWIQNGGRIDIKRLRQTVRAVMPEAIILSNNFDKDAIDFFSKEAVYRPSADDVNQLVSSNTNQAFIFGAGEWWCDNLHNTCVLSPESVFRFIVLSAGTGAPGGGCWATSPLADGKTWSSDNQILKTFLKANSYIKPIRESLTNVAPSKHWTLPDNTRFSDAPAYIATRSLDGTKEYIHVIKRPSGQSLELPISATAEPFKTARLLINSHPVMMERNAAAIRLTLSGKDVWDDLDTVIVLEKK